MKRNKDKKVSTKFTPPSEVKSPRTNKDHIKLINDTGNHNPVWQFQIFDFEHEDWGATFFQKQILTILEKLKSYESRTWNEIYSNDKRDHSVAIENLDSKAKRRLKELERDDIDELLRLRFSGTQRIWGIRNGQIFQILWWDPDHTVCPSYKK